MDYCLNVGVVYWCIAMTIVADGRFVRDSKGGVNPHEAAEQGRTDTGAADSVHYFEPLFTQNI